METKNKTFPEERKTLNHLNLYLEGDKIAVKHILSKLFDIISDDSPARKEVYKYNKVDEDLEGLEVGVRVSEKPKDSCCYHSSKPHAVIIAVDVAAEEPFDIEESLESHKHTETTTLVLIINNKSTKSVLKASKEVVQEEYKHSPRAIQIESIASKIKKDLNCVNHLMEFTETDDANLQSTFDSILNMALVLSSDSHLMSLDKKKKALFQEYNHHWLYLSQKNILHLLAQRNLGKSINKLADDISDEDMFKLLSEQDINKNTPLVTAAFRGCGVALAAMLNFYSSNINMSEIHKPENAEKKEIINKLLHTTDTMNHNLPYHIIQTSKKFLGPYGTILQMEKDYHVSEEDTTIENTDNEEEEDSFLKLNICFQKYQGSTVETSLAMKLFDSTKEVSKGAMRVRVVIFVFLFIIFDLTLHVSDVVTDGLLGKKFYGEWVHGRATGTAQHDNGTLQFYPTQLQASYKFMYYLIFMLSPCILYFVDILRNFKWGTACMKNTEQKETKLKNVTDWAIVILLPVIMWPVIINIKKAYLRYKYYTTSGPEQLQWKAASKEMAQKAGIVLLSEVCIESTFLSILNWYDILPTLLVELDRSLDTEHNRLSLSTVSFLFSILSLAWSYTSYIADQKDGALGLTWDPASRLVLFISNLLLIFARMNCLVMFMFYFGPGDIYQGMLFILCHVFVMMMIHAYNIVRYMWKRDQSETDQNDLDHEHIENTAPDRITFLFLARLFYVSLLNGLANVFTNNFVHVSLNNQKTLGKKKKKSFYRQTIGDLIFLLENIICMVFGCLTDVAPINNPLTMTYFVAVVFTCHIIGLLLKIYYYKNMHIWRDLTPAFDFQRKSFTRADEKIHFYKKTKASM